MAVLFLRRIRWTASSTDFAFSVNCSLKLSVFRSDVNFSTYFALSIKTSPLPLFCFIIMTLLFLAKFVMILMVFLGLLIL